LYKQIKISVLNGLQTGYDNQAEIMFVR